MFTLLGHVAFVCASVSPSMERHSWQWEGSPCCSFSLCSQPCSPQCWQKQLELPAHRVSSEPGGTEAGNGLFPPPAPD